MTEVTANGVTLAVAPETIRNRMHRAIIHKHIYANYVEIAESLGYESVDILTILTDFGDISPRVKILKGKLDFEFISHVDSMEQIIEKFNNYADSKAIELVLKLIKTVNAMDAPNDSDLTAGALPETVEKKD
jgi:flagellar basal body rod protein FlgF